MNGLFLRLTLMALFLQGYLALDAQEYTPMDLSEGATWSHAECGFKPNWGAVYKFRILGDTLVNSNLYQKVYYESRRGQGICFNCNFTFNRDSAELFALIRQSIPKKKVYFVYPSLIDKEWLLYDFDISNVGEPIQGFCLIFSTEPESPIAGIYVYQLEVDYIDSTCVNGEYVKRYFFGNGNAGNIYHRPEFWIEGLGSTHGLLVPGFGGPDWVHNLYCFSNKNGAVYYDSTAILSCVAPSNLTCDQGMDCLGSVAIRNYNPEDPIHVYPNPFHDRIFIESSGITDYSLTLSDGMGRVILARTFHGAGELETVLLGELPAGFYYLSLNANGLITRQKLLKP